MQEFGKQYSKDDKTDPSGFLRRARLHQSVFRAKQLELPFDTYGNYLTKEDGENGKNFYDGYGIFDAVKKVAYAGDLNDKIVFYLLSWGLRSRYSLLAVATK